jgi:hypothetical protein
MRPGDDRAVRKEREKGGGGLASLVARYATHTHEPSTLPRQRGKVEWGSVACSSVCSFACVQTVADCTRELPLQVGRADEADAAAAAAALSPHRGSRTAAHSAAAADSAVTPGSNDGRSSSSSNCDGRFGARFNR